MKPQIELQRLNAFVDGELDLASQLEVEERMREDGALREQVEALRRLRVQIREAADYHAAPAALRRRIATRAAPRPAEPKLPRASTVVAAAGRWLAWRPTVTSLGLVAALAVPLNLVWLHSWQDSRMLDDVVASHVRSTLGQRLVDVASSDRHTVKPWLSSKLDFSPPVNELHIPGSVFMGGRVDYLDGRPVAALVYRQGGHIVNSFIWPDAAPDSGPSFSTARGFQTAHWSQGGMTHWVISDLNREEFGSLVRAIQQGG